MDKIRNGAMIFITFGKNVPNVLPQVIAIAE